MAIEYNEDDVIMGTERAVSAKKAKGFVGFMIKKGWVKNKTEGTVIMLIILIILTITTIVLIQRLNDNEQRDPAIESIPESIQKELPESVKRNLR